MALTRSWFQSSARINDWTEDPKSRSKFDPLKAEAIWNLPPPSSLVELQSLQRKEKIRHRFIPKYADLTKGFTWLLKQSTTFAWNDISQQAFESLKHALTQAPLLSPPDYSQDYFLYLASLDSTIATVLVQ